MQGCSVIGICAQGRGNYHDNESNMQLRLSIADVVQYMIS